jgi:UDP-3-O-[3-hydroxymyristoyl] glucosamine N-acyltransferase
MQVHETAIVEPGARIGAETRIWHWVHVMPGAVIGRRCMIGQGCFIGNVRIGDSCKIQNHVSLFDGVTLDDEVFVGPTSSIRARTCRDGTSSRRPESAAARRSERMRPSCAA